MSAFFHFQHTLNRFFNNYKVISILDTFFLKNERVWVNLMRPSPPPHTHTHTHIDTQEKLPSKSPHLLIGLMIAWCVFSRKYCQIFYTNICVEFFLIWKYQEEIHSTLPQKLVIKRGFRSL